ncbi:MAG: UDP-N-acetylglucosamine 2-epimerase [Pseudomonadota bacterium]
MEAGVTKLVGTDSEKIYLETIKLLEDRKLYGSMAKAINPYGDGKAAKRIVKILRDYL